MFAVLLTETFLLAQPHPQPHTCKCICAESCYSLRSSGGALKRPSCHEAEKGLSVLFGQTSSLLLEASLGPASKATCVSAYDFAIHCRCPLGHYHLFTGNFQDQIAWLLPQSVFSLDFGFSVSLLQSTVSFYFKYHFIASLLYKKKKRCVVLL